MNADARRANNLGAVYFSAGRIAEAGEQFRYALAHIEKEDSPTLAAILCNLGQTEAATGRLLPAERHFTDAIAMHRRLLAVAAGPTEAHDSERNLAVAMANLGDVLRRQQRFEEAERTTRQALELKVKLYGEEALETAGVRNNLGIVQYDQGRFDDAERTLQSALTIREAKGSANDPALATTLSNLAAVWISKGNLAAASGALERALTMLEKRYDPSAPFAGAGAAEARRPVSHGGPFPRRREDAAPRAFDQQQRRRP